MKYFIYTIVIMSLLATLNSCTADEIETKAPKVQADIDPTPGSTIPPKKN